MSYAKKVLFVRYYFFFKISIIQKKVAIPKLCRDIVLGFGVNYRWSISIDYAAFVSTGASISYDHAFYKRCWNSVWYDSCSALYAHIIHFLTVAVQYSIDVSCKFTIEQLCDHAVQCSNTLLFIFLTCGSVFQDRESIKYAYDLLNGVELYGQRLRLQHKETGLG